MSDARVAVVTGGSAGIGQAAALGLADEGFSVLALARRSDRFEVLLARGVACAACDIADPGAVKSLFASHPMVQDGVDVLVNSAGVMPSLPFEQASDEELVRVMSINVLGTMHMIRAVMPALVRRKGVIVNLSSALANLPVPGSSLYVATKGAIDAFTRALALEVAPDGVRVNAVQPGLVRSDIWQAAGMPEADYAQMLADRAMSYPLGRTGEPEEIADLISYLASPRARWITGALFAIDGGSSIGRRPSAVPT